MAAVIVLLMFLIVAGVHLWLRSRGKQDVPQPIKPMAEPKAPSGVFLHPGHAWARLGTDGSIRIGIDAFLAGLLGDADDVTLPPRGTKARKGEPLFRLRAGNRVLDVPSPIDGEVVATHGDTATRPWSVTMDPYGVGWVVAVRSPQPKEGLVALKTGPAATAFLREELRRWIDFASGGSLVGGQPILADGGMPLRGAAATLDDAAWEEFVRSFVTDRK